MVDSIIEKKINNIENKFTDWLKTFTEKPVVNSAKILIALWVINKVWNWMKK